MYSHMYKTCIIVQTCPFTTLAFYSHVDYGQRLPLTRVYDLGAPLVSILLTFQASLTHISMDVDAYLGILNTSLT